MLGFLEIGKKLTTNQAVARSNRARRAIYRKPGLVPGFFVDAGVAEANCSFDKLCSKQSLDAKAQRRRPEGAQRGRQPR